MSDAYSLKPIFEKPRAKCPFLGFGGLAHGILIDTKGNQCALKTGSHSPCLMMMMDKVPNWHECPYNTEETRRYIVDRPDPIQVFPEEFQPKGEREWEGIPFTRWLEYINAEEWKA